MGHHTLLSPPRYTYIISQHSPCKLLCTAILVFTDPCQPTVLKTVAMIMPQMTNLLDPSSFSMSPDYPGSSTTPGTWQALRKGFQITLSDCRILESTITVESCQREEKKLEEAVRGKDSAGLVPGSFLSSPSFPAVRPPWEGLLLSPRAGQTWPLSSF